MINPDRVRKRESHLTREAEKQLCLAAQQGDLDARREIGEAHYGFVAQLAKRYSGTVASQGELVQAGYMGLMESIDKYDDSKGTRLLTLAFWSIRRHMLDVIKVNSTASSRDRVDFDAPAPGRIEALPVEYRGSTDEDEEGSLGSCFVDANAVDPHEEAEKNEMAEAIMAAIKRMKPRTQKIVKMRLGIENYAKRGPRTFVEIGEHYGISAERARRIYTSAIEKVRDGLGVQEDG